MNHAALPYDHWHAVLADPRFSPSSAAIQEYLQLTDGIESPVPYNIWSFISLMAALCGDSVALTHGPMGRERLNLGIVLTGVPAIRKSTALSMMQKFAEGLPIQYGPTDTAGQRQGIMSAMMPRYQKDPKSDDQSELSITALEELADFDSDDILARLPDPLKRKSSEIYFVAKELGRLVASTTRELLDFFTDGMDGESFHYQLKNQVIKIHKPLMNMIGATTPQSLGHMMPRGGESHGFLSRLIFVHASTISKEVAVPERWTDSERSIRDSLHERILDMLASQQDAELYMTEAAKQTYRDLYAFQPMTTDIRLQAYAGRRASHMLKVAAILALLRGNSPVAVQASDVRLSHALLVLTEGKMDRAFYGLDTGIYSKVLCNIAEMAEGAEDGSISLDAIQSLAGHIAPKNQINDIVESLVHQGKLVSIKERASDPIWALNTKQEERSKAHLNTAFKAGVMSSKTVGPDEFRTHKFGIAAETIKGGVGT